MVLDSTDSGTSSSSFLNSADGGFRFGQLGNPVDDGDWSGEMAPGVSTGFMTRQLFPAPTAPAEPEPEPEPAAASVPVWQPRRAEDLGVEQSPVAPAKKRRRGPRSRCTQYRGVTFYRRTGYWYSHIWDCGKLVYLGGYVTAHAAARVYDRAAIKFRGLQADINFSLGDYEDDLEQLRKWKEEFVQMLLRQSIRFTRGSSMYSGVTPHKCGSWELLGKMDDDISTGTDDLERIVSGSKRPDKLKLSVLRHITENFSDKQKIGQGGCGVVYKGILPSGQVVAVKKLFSNKTHDDRMFQQEVTAMMMVEHQNTIRFLGYCSHIEERALEISGKYILAEERERLLCFDYISKGSLHDYVTDELRGLEWHTRFQVIKGICEGLHHLHKEKGIIHMDLKPANILLDDDLVPKITDFGISRPGEISVTMSKERLFSLGYCAPEYQFNGKMSFKSDIYGLGVIIREMVTGSKEEPDVTIVRRRWMHRWKKSGQYIALALAYQQQVTECLELAERCMHRYPIKRPTIQDVICQLNEMDRAAASHINGANNSTFEQKMRMSSFSEDMIGIEPLQLHFPVVINKQTSCSIQLTNDTDDYIAFRVLTASRLPCYIHPNNDIIPPQSICIVTIALEVQQKPLLGDGIEEFCVQSTRVDEGLTVKDILETEDMFEEEPDKIVDMVNLTVRALIRAQEDYYFNFQESFQCI